MVKSTLFAIVLAVSSCGQLLAESATARETASVDKWLQSLIYEFKELRRALVEERLERQQARIEALETELAEMERERQDVEELQKEREQDLIALDQRIADAAITPEQRTELQGLRTELSPSSPEDRVISMQRESGIRDKLRQGYTQLQALRALTRSLAGPETHIKR